MDKKLKLYVMSDSDLNYGAPRSLRFILQNEPDEFDLLMVKVDRPGISDEELREYAGKKCRNIHRFYLKRDISHCWNYTFVWKGLVKNTYLKYRKRFLEKQHLPLVHALIEENRYDYVHLNSLILYPLITQKYNFILHVREVPVFTDKYKKKVTKYLNQTKGLVFIGEGERAVFPDIQVPSLIIINPFEMKMVQDVDPKPLLNQYALTDEHIIVTMMGLFAVMKGVDLVIRAMNQTTNKKIKLLIVGQSYLDQEYQMLQRMMADNDNIIYCGETKTPEDYYSFSDYIIRADKVPTPGRTVFEAFYSGCSVIMQRETEAEKNNFVPEEFQSKLVTYKIRDVDSLTSALNQLEKPEKKAPEKTGNVAEYMETFFEFIDEVIYKK